jgi:hypothetical protein
VGDPVAVMEHGLLELPREIDAARRAALGDLVVDCAEVHESP